MESLNDSYTFEHNGFFPKDRYGVICVKMTGLINHESFAQNLLPRLKQNYEKYKEIRILAYFEDYKGWQANDFAMDILETSPYRHHIKRLALVNPPAEGISFPLPEDVKSANTLKSFAQDDVEEALLWVNT
tara:strand:- start:232166 stop:232558 length:393 start_codon:yes stop_codon:yes gene_type:complete